MILIKVDNNCIVNADTIHAITLGEDNTVQFEIDGGLAYSKQYNSAGEAQEAFDKLFSELAHTPGVDGAILG